MKYRLYTAWFLVLLTAVLSFPLYAQEEAFISIGEEPEAPGFDERKSPEETIQRITITGVLDAPDPRSIPGQLSIVSAEEIKASGARDAAEIIEPVLGVSLSRYGGSGSSSFISIRGSSAEQVLVLINGKRINTAQGGGVDLSTISTDRIERVEVYRGGDSAFFGENAVGGVVNIITKASREQPFEASVRAGYGSFETVFGSASVSSTCREGKLGGGLSAHGLTSRGDYSFEDDHFGTLQRENADVMKGGAAANLFFKPVENLEIGTEVTFYTDEKGVPGTVEFPSVSARMADERETAGVELGWKNDFGDLTLSGDLVRQVREYQDPDFYLGETDDRHENIAAEGELRYDGSVNRPSWAAAWLGGGSIRRDSLNSTAFTGSAGAEYEGEDISRTRLAGFARSELRLFPYEKTGISRLALLPAVRVDSWNTGQLGETDASGGIRPSGTIGVLSSLTSDETVVIKSSAGTSYRTPSFDDLFWPATAFASGNPDLEPEEAVYIDGGFVLKPLASLEMEAAVFYRTVENLIQWNPGPNGQWRPVNIGRSRFIGGEAEFRGLLDLPGISSYLESKVNGTYLFSEDLTEDSAAYGKAVPRRPLWQVNGIAALTHAAGHTLRLEMRYVGIRYITAANTKWYDPYFIIDLSAGAALGDGFDLILHIDNLFNIEYVDIREYPVPGTEMSVEARYEY